MIWVMLSKKMVDVTHNVGNIRYNSRNTWLGQCGNYKGFCKFINEDYAIRALIILLLRYRSFGLTDVSAIINRYAPQSENETSVYISFVRRFIGSDSIVSLGHFLDLVRSICYVETSKEFSRDYITNVIINFKLDLPYE